MGIDVYLKWKDQTPKQAEAQLTGFSVVAGDKGYLREAYHGGPYATKALVPECWSDWADEDGEPIPSATLRERLPGVVMVALYRHHAIYEQGDDPSEIELDDGGGTATLHKKLGAIFGDMANREHESLMEHFTHEQINQAEALIEQRALPDYALSFVDFVRLAEQEEARTGEPCRVYVSA